MRIDLFVAVYGAVSTAEQCKDWGESSGSGSGSSAYATPDAVLRDASEQIKTRPQPTPLRCAQNAAETVLGEVVRNALSAIGDAPLRYLTLQAPFSFCVYLYSFYPYTQTFTYLFFLCRRVFMTMLPLTMLV